VNLSSREFAITDPAERCAQMLSETAVPPDAIRFELTETAVMEDVEGSISQLRRLSEIGVKVALDDFGTGHSSLAYLSRLPIAALKIDHSFVWALGDSDRETAIIEAIITMGQTLGLEICAEGIESEHQRRVLERLGCAHGQGFLFSLPLESIEFAPYVAAEVERSSRR
jgi:EAL domain-containing protein (putative c-di-GMP-specific phosphodiesterase class I)